MARILVVAVVHKVTLGIKPLYVIGGQDKALGFLVPGSSHGHPNDCFWISL
jgi:hypothetical protein